MNFAGWVNALIAVLFISIVSIILLRKVGAKGFVALSAIVILSAVTSFFSFKSLISVPFSADLAGPAMFGPVSVELDSLSAWFILVINFTMLTGAFYGFNYMRKYSERKNAITLHTIAFILVHFSLVGVCLVRNSFIFLLLWEVMALAVFILVIFESSNPSVIKAGINYLVQSHISIVLLMLGFMYYAVKAGSYDFDAITQYSSSRPSLDGTALFILFFAGFALKAGFIPFHTWLPLAHPAAPSHVSGIMSGVVIKIGIYGILRILLVMKVDWFTAGCFILVISLVSGVYGVMLATIQHDLKRLLAYHSIENIGIIGIGIGAGCIGMGTGNTWMAVLGFSGALLHTLNHSLFKSLLFYSAGNILQAVHSMNIEKMGGIMKKMPSTALLFLLAALAICGLPPLNGFISEFIIYGSLYNWLFSAGVISQVAVVFALTGLALIGGLAILCFTKAFSIVFLGTARSDYGNITETSKSGLIPMYFTGGLIILIGLFPSFFIGALKQPVNLLTAGGSVSTRFARIEALDSLTSISRLSALFIVLVLLIIGIRKVATRKSEVRTGPTWGCGYPAADSKLQYTATSYVRTYSKLARPVLEIEKHEDEVTEIFPGEKHYETHPYDKVEKVLIDRSLKLINRITDAFRFLQNGRLQRYILYGIIFITTVLLLPLLWDKIMSALHILKSL